MTASPYVLLDDSLTQGGRSLLYAEPERFFSYRRMTKTGEADYGRHINAIALTG